MAEIKKATTYEEQLEILEQRGIMLIIETCLAMAVITVIFLMDVRLWKMSHSLTWIFAIHFG